MCRERGPRDREGDGVNGYFEVRFYCLRAPLIYSTIYT